MMDDVLHLIVDNSVHWVKDALQVKTPCTKGIQYMYIYSIHILQPRLNEH